ncbi:unnamed protein product [Camellia sinensis]
MVGFKNDGKVLALDLEIYNNAGNSLDLYIAILERAMFHSDNVYEIPNVKINGRVCFTNFPSNIAFRGFGGPQGMLITENWVQRIALELKKSPEEIRLWNELKSSCDFLKARKEVEKFNFHNRWKKRGVAMVPTKFGISFTTKFMNQAGALVQVYTDGTVLVAHRGVEMGQGLHTKVAQVYRLIGLQLLRELMIDSPLDPVDGGWKGRSASMLTKLLATACYMERIDLSAHGFYITLDIGFDWKTGKGNPFRYFTYGAAFAEVEIDTLTGDFHTRTTNIFLDLGYFINPAIDVGQY